MSFVPIHIYMYAGTFSATVRIEMYLGATVLLLIYPTRHFSDFYTQMF